MKILKKIGLTILVLIVVVSVISLFFPTEMKVERSIVINAPTSVIFPNVNAMENWKKWGGPWHEEGMDFSKVIQRIEGAPSGVGSKLIYDQGRGEGSVEVVENVDGKALKTLISFEDGGSANGTWTFEPAGNSTTVAWSIQVDLGYNPLKRILGNLFMDGKVGPLFEKGLANIKKLSEGS